MSINTKHKGEISEAAIVLALLKKGISVSRPVGENQRYDLVVDDGGLKRVQCKTARLHNGSLVSDIGRVCYEKVSKKSKHYSYSNSEFDVIALYAPELNKCYWIEVTELVKSSGALPKAIFLRLDPITSPFAPKQDTRWAKDYEL